MEYLGRKGSVSNLMRLIPTLPLEERPSFGQRVNRVKGELTASHRGARPTGMLASIEVPRVPSSTTTRLPTGSAM